VYKRQALTAHLHALGLRSIGDVLELPRAAFSARFGPAWLDDLDRALGTRPDPQPAFAPPANFSARIDLPADVTDSAQLMLPAQRLLHLLEGFLRGRDAGATELVFSVRHSPRRAVPLAPTCFTLALAAPERDAMRLGRLLTERIGRIALPAPAVALDLTVEHLQPFAARNASLLPPAPGAHGTDTGWLQLAETLHARLGSERVFQLHAADDHRPEHAYRIAPLAVHPAERSAQAVPLPAAPRPLLLLTPPQPLPCHEQAPHYSGALTLLAGPERIESGWWDLAHAAHGPARRSVLRDYFVARNPRGQTLWVYRELAAPRGWYLHGLFA
jgi:protein ImuB